jgi:hypothetical protein
MDSVRPMSHSSTSLGTTAAARNGVVGKRASTASSCTITTRTRSSSQPKRSTRQAASNFSASLQIKSSNAIRVSTTTNNKGQNDGAARGEKLDTSKSFSTNHNTRARNGIRKEMRRVSCFLFACVVVELDLNHFLFTWSR